MFKSPTYGNVSFEKACELVLKYMESDPRAKYKVVIGTDSQVLSREINFTTALIVHKVGKGAIYFIHREYVDKGMSFQTRIYTEASMSLKYASQLTEIFAEHEVEHDIEIHLDVGDTERNRTKELVKQVVGMVTGSGFTAYIKPFSYGASSVADKYTKR